MKIYRSLPDKVIVRNICYKLDAGLSALKQIPINKRYVKVNVLAKSLEGKTDLHGNLYKPSIFIFVETGEYYLSKSRIAKVTEYLKNNTFSKENIDCFIERIREKNGTANDYK